MTSTSYNIGLMEGRSSSRVLRPPGGGHTDIFGGGEPEPVRKGRGRPQLQNQNVVPAEVPPPNNTPTNGSTEPEAKVEAVEPAVEPTVPEKTVENPIVEKPVEPMPSPVKEEAKVEPPKRIRVPPGGFSSGLW